MRQMRVIVLALLLLQLAACAGMRAAGVAETEFEERQVLHLIDYAQRVTRMPAEKQRFEFRASDQAYANDRNALNRLRLALLLALPGTGFHDTARAAQLLEPMAAPDQAATPLHAFAQLFHAQLQELGANQRRLSQLREQIEALKSVERSLLERGQVSTPRNR